MQWFSSKKNPAARYLPDVFSADEQHFAYRLLSSAAVKTDNRATSTGAIVIDGAKYIAYKADAYWLLDAA